MREAPLDDTRIDRCSKVVAAECNFSFSILMNVGAMTARPPWLVKRRLSVQVLGEIGRAQSITCNPLARSRLIEFDSASSCQVSVKHMIWILVSLISCLMTSTRAFSHRPLDPSRRPKAVRDLVNEH